MLPHTAHWDEEQNEMEVRLEVLEKRMESLEGSSKSMCDVVKDIQQSNTWTDMKVKDCIEKGGQRPVIQFCSYIHRSHVGVPGLPDFPPFPDRRSITNRRTKYKIQIKIYIAPNSLIKRDRGAGWSSARW